MIRGVNINQDPARASHVQSLDLLVDGDGPTFAPGTYVDVSGEFDGQSFEGRRLFVMGASPRDVGGVPCTLYEMRIGHEGTVVMRMPQPRLDLPDLFATAPRSRRVASPPVRRIVATLCIELDAPEGRERAAIETAIWERYQRWVSDDASGVDVEALVKDMEIRPREDDEG